MPIVTPRDGESAEALITRFTKLVQRDGVLREFKRRRHFISKSEQRRTAAEKAARKRARHAARAAARAAARRPSAR
jgi:small subunit ribosomal protein S21